MNKTMKFLLLLLTLASGRNAYAQTTSQKQLEKDFVRAYCNCLEKFESEDPEKILYNVTEQCIRGFFTDPENIKEFEKIVKEREFEASLTDYEKGRILGKEIVYNTIDDLVKDCKAYRRSLSEYKAILMSQLNVTRESAANTIAQYKRKELLLIDAKEKAMYFSILGIMYEFVDNKKEALACYDKSMEHYPTTQAKGLRLLLKKE